MFAIKLVLYRTECWNHRKTNKSKWYSSTSRKEKVENRGKDNLHLDNFIKQFNIQDAWHITCTKVLMLLAAKPNKNIEVETSKKIYVVKIKIFWPGFSPEIILLSAGSTPTTWVNNNVTGGKLKHVVNEKMKKIEMDEAQHKSMFAAEPTFANLYYCHY